MIDIIATIGPSSINYSVLKRMAVEGMSVARVNMKFSSIDELMTIKERVDKLGVKLLIDLPSIKRAGFIKDFKIDYVALSFTNSSKQVTKLRRLLKNNHLIIAKIETKKGVLNIKEIIEASDGLMVARGDLGNNVKLEYLPIYQKSIINECNNKGKYVITATEMLLSMVNAKKPTKSEVSDVANAVMDGSNALMLSEETAIGKYPVLAVRTMKKIIEGINKYQTEKNFLNGLLNKKIIKS
jgi:pyruvate kinase